MAGKKKLGALMTRNALAARIIELAEAGAEVDLDWLEAELSDARRFDIVASLKELEDAGAGTFVVGRRGRKSRFIWSESAGNEMAPVEPGGAAAPSVAAAPARNQPSNRVAESVKASRPLTLQHSFHLRMSVITVLELPADITKLEVDRLCGFLQAIPFQ